MNMSKKSKILWLVVIVVVALVAVVLWARSRTNNADRAGNTADGSDQLESAEDTSEGSVNKKPAVAGSSGTSAPALTYTQALAKYAGRVVQFDEQCQATPSSITLKNNTDIMLDNRSSQSRVLTVGGSYTVKGYSYKIIKLSSGVLPRTILADCQGQQNVATIYLQP